MFTTRFTQVTSYRRPSIEDKNSPKHQTIANIKKFHDFIKYDQFDKAEELIMSGQDVNREYNNFTPLQRVLMHSENKIAAENFIKFLLENGAHTDLGRCKDASKDPVQLARDRGFSQEIINRMQSINSCKYFCIIS